MFETERGSAGGPEEEKWAEWLVEDKNEYDQIRSDELKVIIRLLARRPESMITREVLQKDYDRIDDLLRAGKITDSEAALWQSRIAEKHFSTEEEGNVKVKVDVGPLQDVIRTLAEGQTKLAEALESQRVTFEQFLNASQQQSEDLAESLRTTDPKVERERWVDAEYSTQFYTRFTPNLEPRFYQKLDSKERKKFDVRWQLARAAFVKMATSGMPDKYKENQDLTLLGKDQMETLYKIPGVRQMLEGYAKAIAEGKNVTLANGRQMSFWDIKSAEDFEEFRKGLRGESLRHLSDDLSKKEADAVAWNLIWISNLVESADSRYSLAGALLGGDLPSAICAGEYKYVLHPQERFEGKSTSGHFWGVYGKWGVTQINLIKENLGLGKDDEFRFIPGKREEYWSAKKTNEPASRADRAAKGGKVVDVKVPECYPVSVTGSYFEETKLTIEGIDRDGKATFNRKSLLDFLLAGDQIPWDNESLLQDAWSIYAFGKFGKAVSLLETFTNEDPKKGLLEGNELTWAFPLRELYTRLNPEDALNTLIKEGKTFQSFHNLKVWAAYAGRGGVSKIFVKDVTSPFGPLEGSVVAAHLKSRQVGYLDPKESFSIQ